MSRRPQISSSLGRDRPQLALGAYVVEVDGEGAQQLLGHEIDGLDVGIEEAGHVTLEEIGVGDVYAAQTQLHVEGRRQPLVEGGVGLDDVHPAADLGQVVRIDHRLPFIGGALDLGVLEPPVEHVLDEVVGGGHVAGFADGHADGFVALEAHQQELVVARPEEAGEAAEDAVDVHLPLGLS